MGIKTFERNLEIIEQCELLLSALKEQHGEAAQAHKKSFKEGFKHMPLYEDAREMLQTTVGELFGVLDLHDPEDAELMAREAGADEEEEEDDEDEAEAMRPPSLDERRPRGSN